jgi:hypothetical protein
MEQPDKGLTVTEKQKSLDIDTEEGTATEGESVARRTIRSVGEILQTLSAAVKGGQITAKQARSFRQDLGITQSFFTRKQTTPAQRKAKRLQQKKSRKINRGRVKGQKRTSGRR